MGKELPGVFSNPINKEIKNNTDYYYSILKSNENRGTKEIIKKVNDIFSRKDFVYKKRVQIKTIDDVLNVTLVGRNNANLLTIDNQSIPITNIIDIELLN